MSFFSEKSYELQNSWFATDSEPQKLTKAELRDIKSASIRCNTLSDGTVLRNIVFIMANGKPRSIKLSRYDQEQFADGTRINPNSVIISEFTNDDGDLTYTATCEEA